MLFTQERKITYDRNGLAYTVTFVVEALYQQHPPACGSKTLKDFGNLVFGKSILYLKKFPNYLE